MAKERHRWVIYYDETLLMKMNRLREETAIKDNEDVSQIVVSQVVRALIEEKYVEYVDKKNNRSRITTLEEAVKMLTQKIDMLITLLMKGDNHVPTNPD